MPSSVTNSPIRSAVTSAKTPTTGTGTASTNTATRAASAGASDAFEAAKAASPIALTMPSTAEIQRSVEGLSAGIRTKQAVTLADLERATLKLDAGVQTWASVDRGQLSLQFDPGMKVDPKPGPEFTIKSIRYDFETATFKVDAEGWGPDFMYSQIAAWVANAYVRPMLPAQMQRPGYNPQMDTQLVSTLQNLLTANGASAGSADILNALEEPQMSFNFKLKEDYRLPLADGQAEVLVPGGTPFLVTADLDGLLADPTVNNITVKSLGRSGISVQQTSGPLAGLAGLEIKEAKLGSGGEIAMDYKLNPEQAAEVGFDLLKLFAFAAGDSNALKHSTPDVRMEAFRRIVDEQVSKQIRPALIDVLREYDTAIPGLSLAKAFGI